MIRVFARHEEISKAEAVKWEHGAYCDIHYTRQVARQDNFAGDMARAQIVMKEFAHGCVVNTREFNGYDDSDFYATYYDAEAGEFREVMYATTRGWTYPCHATIDATPEVLELWKAERARRAEVARKLEAERLERLPSKGRRVRILPNKGKAKIYAGREAVVFWFEEQRSQFGTWSRGYRVGVQIEGTNERVFLAWEKCERLPQVETA